MSDLDIIRRIADRGLNIAQESDKRFIDIFQHILDEINRIPVDSPVFAIHKKTDNRYMIVGSAINATNVPLPPDALSVVYFRDKQLFVREFDEFNDKFEIEPKDKY